MTFSIAIDGPAGAGKSTIAKEIAKRLQFIYIDTGAMYRTIALYYMDKGIECDKREAVLKELDTITISIDYVDEVQHVFLGDSDVTNRIRTQQVGENASKVSAIAEVRAKLVAIQQELARKINVVMDGRDIGSVVLPDAPLKIYLTAGSRVRAERRYKEYIEKGVTADLDTIEKEIIDRDYRDMHRDASPLVCVPDAVVIDSSYMTVDEVADRVIELVKERM